MQNLTSFLVEFLARPRPLFIYICQQQKVSTNERRCYIKNTLLMIGKHWVRLWVGAVWQQAIIWANVDSYPFRLMASLGHNEFKIVVAFTSMVL